jgi:sirohydrochlorin ferrochelatase
MMEAVLYIAHGSSRGAANDTFLGFITKVMKKSSVAIQAYAFLEHAEPSITQAIEACIEKGAEKIIVVPVLLLTGVHANVDIPAAFASYPQMVFQYAKPLGIDDIMVEILEDRLTEAGFSKRADVTVLLVGHGSRELATAVEFESLAVDLSKKIGSDVHTAYLTTPVYYDEMVKRLFTKKIYILPYLLFAGGYMVKMEKAVEEQAQHIKMCGPVGFDEKLIRLIEKRINEVR